MSRPLKFFQGANSTKYLEIRASDSDPKIIKKREFCPERANAPGWQPEVYLIETNTKKYLPTDEPAERHQHYLVYGQRMCSNLPMPELPRADFVIKDLEFRYFSGGIPRQKAESLRLVTKRSTNLGCDLLVYETQEEFLIQWDGKCDFWVSKDGRCIRCSAAPSAGTSWISATLYGTVLAFAMHLRGTGCLHASAVALPQGAVGFLAEPGTGKSTLSAAFAASGYPFVTDDVLVFQEMAPGYVAHPGFPFVSLSEIAVTQIIRRSGANKHQITRLPLNENKDRISIDGEWASFSSEPVPLRGLFILNRTRDATDVSVERLSRIEAIQGLLENTNCLPILPNNALRAQIALASGVTGSVPVWRLNYPTGLQHTSRVIEQVLALIAQPVDLRGWA